MTREEEIDRAAALKESMGYRSTVPTCGSCRFCVPVKHPRREGTVNLWCRMVAEVGFITNDRAWCEQYEEEVG